MQKHGKIRNVPFPCPCGATGNDAQNFMHRICAFRGTNDLTQYTLAADRQEPSLEAYYEPRHEAVLRLIEMSVQSAHRHGIWVGVCGELAADPASTDWFYDLEVDELSVSPPMLPRLYQQLSKR